MSKSKVKWGIIAAGSIANAFAHSIKYSENSEIKSVLGRNEEKVNAFDFRVFGIFN
jgi:predicted dehydrogenase